MKKLIDIIAISVLMSACYVQKPLVRKVEPGYSDVSKQLGRVRLGEVYRLHLLEGKWLDLRLTQVDNIEVTGLTHLRYGAGADTVKYKSELVEKHIPISSIQRITKRQYDPEMTSGVIVGGLAAGFVILLLLGSTVQSGLP